MAPPKPRPRSKAQANQAAKQRGNRTQKTSAEEKKEYKKKLSDMIEAERLRLEIDDYRLKKVIEQVVGVGKFGDWMDETEKQFVNAAPSQPKSEGTETTRPKLRKISKRKRRQNKLLDKK